jgi:flagellar biosynthesis component FlhA
LLGLSASLG